MGPTGPEDSLEFLQTKGKTFGTMATFLFSMFSRLEVECGFSRSKVQFSGGIFLLPDCPRAIQNILGHIPEGQLHVFCGMCKALNSYNGCPWTDKGLSSAPAKRALVGLAANVRDSELALEKFEGVTWESFGSVRTVMRLKLHFFWANVEPALPEGIGSIPLLQVCERGTLDYVMNFENYLFPEDSRVYTKPLKVFVHDADW